MSRDNLSDLAAFLAVCRERSFTRAAVQLGITQSGLSHAIKELEARLGVRLLTRTTRSVAPTEPGERLLRAIEPHFQGIEAGLTALTDMRDKPAGRIRITTPEHAAEAILWPALSRMLRTYPDIAVDVITEDLMRDIVSERFDAGVRLGEHLEKDMVAVRIGPEMRMAVVGAPDYLAQHPPPERPEDLTAHRCITMRRATRGGIHLWEFDQAGREVKVKVTGQIIFSSLRLIRDAALAGHGLAYLPEDCVMADLKARRLVRVLDDWCEPFPGYHLYYPSRHQHSAAFSIFLNAVRYRGRGASPVR